VRYLVFLCFEVKKHQQAGRLNLAAADDCLADANARITALRRKMDRERVPLAEAAPPRDRAEELAGVLHEAAPEEPAILEAIPVERPRRRPPPPPLPRRNLLEILLDPRSIQWLLAFGGALLVLGLIIWLAAQGLFKDPLVVAGLLGAGNAALLVGGWAVVALTRHEVAGRALTLLACLLMPFNLWFYDAQGLITLQEGHLWIPALVCCALYAISARLLRDPTFVWVFVLGVAGTGLLILADHLVEHFWEIAGPASLLVALGLVCIHAERIFPEGDSPFSRRRFGLAFFWSGHVLLAVGLLLLLAAHLAGDWLWGLFEPIYREFHATQPAIVTDPEGRLLSLALVLAATYAYAYSDLVVRRVGAYLWLAVGTLLWAEVLVIRMFPWPVPAEEVVILALALTGLVANLTLRAAGARGSGLMRAGPPLALVLGTLPVALGVILHYRATVFPEGFAWHYSITWTYVGAMLAAAVSCRVGAFLYRRDRPGVSATYFFGTGAATLAGAAGLLLVLYPERPGWDFQAPILMVIPLLYLAAARLYGEHTPARPLTWVAHAATGVMLVSSIGAAFRGFLLISQDPLNLSLALFFAEAALFYLLAAAWRREPFGVYASTATACAAVWQVLTYAGFQQEFYILTFAVVGLLLLVGYRFAVLERTRAAGLAGAAFQCGNALLSLAFVAAALLTLGEVVGGQETQRGVLLSLLSSLSVIGLVSVGLVRQEGWRRWYVATTITQVALIVLVLAVFSRLTPWQRLEVVCVVIGLLLLVAGHLGWYREQEQHSDLVSVSLFFGSVLVALPLTIATVACRIQSSAPGYTIDTFHTVNEVGMLVAALALLATGFMCQIKSTTLAGSFLTAAYLVTLLLYLRIPERLQTTAVYIMVGGGLFFAAGLLLSLYRDRLLRLPERIKRREGVFRVLTWR
jgi:hypothetical protein